MSERSKVIKCADFRWTEVMAYKPDPSLYKDVTRQTIVGDGSNEVASPIVARYFEVQPGGFSTLEYHEHRHIVFVVRGRGTVQLGDEESAIAPFDAVYVAPSTVHQFRAAADAPLGFICVVERKRDRATPVRGSPQVRG